MADGTWKNEDAVNPKAHQEEIKIPIISFSDTITNPENEFAWICSKIMRPGFRWNQMLRKRCSSPWAVMVEPLNAVVTDWTMWGPRRSENLACETVFELDRLVSNGNLSRPRRRSVSCPIRSIVLAVKKIVVILVSILRFRLSKSRRSNT